MSVIDDIKARLDIVDYIGGMVKLKRAGKNYSGLCPFHNEKTASFIVFPGTGTWRCFGQCSEGGDVLDFAMKKEGWDMQETVRQLAARAGVVLRPQNAEEQAAQQKRREREAVLGTAMRYFQTRMGEPIPAAILTPGMEYAAYVRRWSVETIRAAGLGWFGMDWDGLRQALAAANIDLESPAAAALVGFKGDVAAWGVKYGIAVPGVWVENQKIPAMPPYMLIYPHVYLGRVSYLSGRRINPDPKGNRADPKRWDPMDGPKSWNPDADLVDSKQPLFNHVWWADKTARIAVVVEGQADAVTLGEWGIAAVALAGSSVPGADELLREARS